MTNGLLYAVLADLVLFLHLCFVLFVVLSLVCIFVGKVRHWQWVYHPTFRGVHLACIAVVVAQAWLGVVCPLTTLEMHLRGLAGEATYAGGFIAHWMSTLLYYQAPDWVFTLIYTLFGLAVVASWFLVRPRGTL